MDELVNKRLRIRGIVGIKCTDFALNEAEALR
jgi:hypothetical protein